MPVAGLGFRFKPSAEQEAAIERLLADQQNPASPHYHEWLTLEEYGERFGISSNDLGRVSDWVQAQGFRIDAVARSRTWIRFSGTAAHVRHTFKTELLRYRGKGRMHFANAADPEIPADLAPLVYRVRGLDDFPSESKGKVKPLVNLNSGGHALAPGDLAVIYNVNPLYQRGLNGSGQKIVVAGQNTIKLSDVQAYRNMFGLPKNDPRLIAVPGLPDPEFTEEDYNEGVSDVEIAGAAAPNASILYVYSPYTEASAEYAIDQNLAPVISNSYGICERKATAQPAGVAEYHSLALQANAQGITWVSCTGDAGAAGCERQVEDPAGKSGMSVELPASFPEVTAVGGTRLDDGAGSYWTQTSGANSASALSYIPEIGWNDTAVKNLLAVSGGGSSMFYGRPAWQSGPGVPPGNARHTPDISFAASWDHDPYLIIVDGHRFTWGGTSAATPFFAGMLALLNQHLVSTGAQSRPGLGNINPRLYQLAQTTTGVFHDITAGDGLIPCVPGTPDCTTGRYGFSAGPGYDRLTGLGSLDIARFFDAWTGTSSTPSAIPTALTVSANPSTLFVNGSAVLTATVKAASGSAAPSGSIAFNLGKTALGTASISGSGTATLTIYGSQLAIGVNTVTAAYSGAANFAPSTGSAAITVSVPAAASAVVPSIVPSPVYQQAEDSDGFAWFYTVRLTEIAGTPTTITSFAIDGADHTADIATWFGSTTLPAHGSLSAALRSRGLTVPSTRTYSFGGMDSTGQRWSQQISVPFLPQQISASMALSSAPAAVARNPKGDPKCAADHPFYQELNLQEQNGYEVQLTKFVAGSFDLTDQIATWFGSLRLAPLGTLRAYVCWQIDAVPSTITYQVEGVDTAGHKIATTLQVPFKPAPSSAGDLVTSSSGLALSAAPSASATASLRVSVPAGEEWSVSPFPANQKSSWLVVFPQSGKGPAQVNLVASAAGLPNGVYTATLVFQSANTLPQFANVPVRFTIGESSSTVVTGVQNAASFQQAFAPGMLMSVYGRKLAGATESASSLPLPLTLAGVSATVNGVPAPLWFVSPGQVNLQIPYETPAGPAILALNNNGQVSSYDFKVTATAPGIFNGSAALTRGAAATLYITGDGELTPMIDTGAPPPANLPISGLPKPRAPISVTVGGVPAQVVFAGNPWLVGVTQINFTVPANAAVGTQPVVVKAGESSSVPAMLNVR
jgi:uncharacterized protein (TIGR03437 family)